jgi:hypothetical protein
MKNLTARLFSAIRQVSSRSFPITLTMFAHLKAARWPRRSRLGRKRRLILAQGIAISVSTLQEETIACIDAIHLAHPE